MTPFDEYTTPHALQITKLFIPFLPPQTQRSMAIYIKFLEFRNIFSSFRGMKQAVSSPDEILNSLKPYMNSSDLESFDQAMNMMSMMSMMQEMQIDPSSMFTDMFTQENHMESKKEGETNDGLDE